MPLQPPKAWWDKMYRKVRKSLKKAHPRWGNKRLRQVTNKTVGDIWYNRLTDPKRREILLGMEGSQGSNPGTEAAASTEQKKGFLDRLKEDLGKDLNRVKKLLGS